MVKLQPVEIKSWVSWSFVFYHPICSFPTPPPPYHIKIENIYNRV
jgi:hypothetical protein